MMMNKTGMVHEISRMRMIWTSKWVITVDHGKHYDGGSMEYGSIRALRRDSY